MQDETALYGAKMMQPGLTVADNEENSLRPQHLEDYICLLYTSPSPRDGLLSRMPSSA